MPHPLTGPVVGYFSRLAHPTLFRVTLALMVLSWLLPDPIPFLDEIATALAVMVFANWRKRRESPVQAGDPGTADPRVLDGEAHVVGRKPPPT